MDPRRKPDADDRDTRREDIPALEEQDWDALAGEAAAPDGAPENGDRRYDAERSGEAPEEDDDNAYQNSDEALPDDREEAAITRNPSKEGGRFDEV